MSANDEQILAYIRDTAKVRAVQVADKFDMELEDARTRLLALVDVGDLVESNGFSPNGHACKIYDVKVTGPKVTVELKPSSASAAPTLTPAGDSKQLTKAEKAIALIREKGEVTSAELHTAMELLPEQYPSNYLASALKAGVIVKDGKHWRLGSGTPVPPAPPGKANWSLHLPGSTPHAETMQPPKPAKPSRTPKPVEASQDVKLRAAMWSDGQVELQRAGQTIASLQREEAEYLFAFLMRTMQPATAEA